MWPEPLLALGFNRGKTAPGGGCGSYCGFLHFQSWDKVYLVIPWLVFG